MSKLLTTLALAIVCWFGYPAYAQDGVPDLDYGTMGRAQRLVCIVCPPSAHKIAFDAQGRVVIGAEEHQGVGNFGDVYAVRFTLEGQVDSSFGENGKAEGVFCTDDDVVLDMDIAADGSIYLAGYESWTLADENPGAVLRWTPDGQLDETFGPQGVHTTDLGFHTYVRGVVALPDGKVMLAVNHSLYLSGDSYTKLVRLTHEGELDTTFGGGDGIVDYPQFSAYSATFRELIRQPDGKFLGLIHVFEVGNVLGNMVVRFEADGTLDPTFSGDGIVEVPGSALSASMFLGTGGRITVFVRAVSSTDHGVYRFLPDGSPDFSYGFNGEALFTDSLADGFESAMMNDGRFLVGNNVVDDLGIICITNDGTIDPDFGQDGYAMPAIFDDQSTTGHIAVGPEQRFAVTTSAESDHPLAEYREVAAYMFTADSLWDQQMGVEEAEFKTPVLFPSIYAGGCLWLSAPAVMRGMQWCIVDNQGRRVREIPLRPWTSAVAVDISPYLGDVPNGLYLLTGVGAAGEHNSARFVVLR